ncbi:MAG TPA: CoA pyrophosphatase [Xanthobacteraceae bacterium]|nr:CoA pyrophosphatase [Xanthobacteraceae bacterium]
MNYPDTAAEIPISLRDFVARTRERLSLRVPDNLNAPASLDELMHLQGDHQMAKDMAEILADKPFRPAAVLVAVVARETPTFLLTQRAAHLSTHSGQVAFPGGRIDPGDKDPADAAMREAMEEIGLAREYITPLGYLDPYLSGTGFRIVPTVALVRPDFTLAINPAEVTEAFEVPFDFLMSPGNHQRHSREWRGILRNYYAMPYGERYIWGATAGMIRRLYERIYS